MSTLMVFSSKHGTTRKCAQTIASRIQCNLIDCSSKLIDFKDYTDVIFCTPIYFGSISSCMKKLIKNYINVLSGCSLRVYTCGLGGTESAKAAVDRSFSKYGLTIIHEHLGGEVVWECLNFFERLIIKAVLKEEPVPTLDVEKLDKIINNLKADE